MSISEDDVGVALSFLASETVARTKFHLRKAEAEAKRVYSRCFMESNQPNNDLREASAILNPSYMAAQEREIECELNADLATGRRIWAQELLKIYQTVRADIRAAENIR